MLAWGWQGPSMLCRDCFFAGFQIDSWRFTPACRPSSQPLACSSILVPSGVLFVVLIGSGVPRSNARYGGWSGFTSNRYAQSAARTANSHLTVMGRDCEREWLHASTAAGILG